MIGSFTGVKVMLCRICNNQMGKIFSLGQQPLANKYPKSVNEFDAENILEMNAFYCDECGYINLPCEIGRATFFEDYYYLSSINSELVAHFEDLALEIEFKKPKFVLDVGSNDGILLRPLKRLGISCLGIDPSENVSAIANDNGLKTLTGFFDFATGNLIKQRFGSPDLICACSVFTHLDDPKDFFKIAHNILSERGEIIIEVEYLQNIVQELAFERFYFDRPHYYSVRSLARLASENGFTVSDISFVKPHGGSVRLTFQRSEVGQCFSGLQDLLSKERCIINFNTIQELFSDFELSCLHFADELKQLKSDGKKVAGYGCPARLSTITNFCKIEKDLLPYLIEDSPLKQGRFSPGMHIPIVSIDSLDEIDILIVFAYEYIDSIRKKVNRDSVTYYKPIPYSLI